jgi:hypothetical protein
MSSIQDAIKAQREGRRWRCAGILPGQWLTMEIGRFINNYSSDEKENLILSDAWEIEPEKPETITITKEEFDRKYVEYSGRACGMSGLWNFLKEKK